MRSSSHNALTVCHSLGAPAVHDSFREPILFKAQIATLPTTLPQGRRAELVRAESQAIAAPPRVKVVAKAARASLPEEQLRR